MRFRVVFPLFQIIFAVLLIGNLSIAAHGNSSFSLKPVPTWVRTMVPSGSSTSTSGGSSSQLLKDEQTKVASDGSVERYYHFVRRVDGASGLDHLSQLRFYFEPSYQQLLIHFVRIQRGGVTINALKPSEIKTIQQEDELDQQLYNGTLAALIFVNDLRVGDVVDYAYSINGENPVLGGRFADRLYLGDPQPCDEHAIRLLFPSSRSLTIKNTNTDLAPSVQNLGQDTEYFWYQKNISGITKDDYTPIWFDPYPTITLSEFRDWSDVVNWALPFYKISALNNSELRAKIEQWKRDNSSQEQRIVAALRFVQDEVRYLGIELGRYSHQPSLPDQVFARRFGDCKDKSLLLSSILVSMGIDAAPVLINTRARASLDSWQPSPFAFDHVIVRAQLNGKSYWFDPTISYQRGNLETYYDPPYQRGLVLRVGEQSLSMIPPPTANSGSVSIVEVYDGAKQGQPMTLTVKTTYRGSDADEMRYNLSTNSLADLGKEYLNFYADSIPQIKPIGLPVVEDDQAKNNLVVNEKYLIEEFWKNGIHRFFADKIYLELDKPGVSQRTMPLRVRFPVAIDQTISVNLGPGYDFPSGSDVFTNDAMRFEYNAQRNGDQFSLFCSLKTFADSVSVQSVQEHLRVLEQAQNVVGFDLRGKGTVVAASAFPRTSMAFWLFLGFVVFGGIFVVVRLLRDHSPKRSKEFAAKMVVQQGATPETALALATNDQLESLLHGFQCRCGSNVYDATRPPTQERFTYDGQRLVGLRMACQSCGLASDLYVKLGYEANGTGLAGQNA